MERGKLLCSEDVDASSEHVTNLSWRLATMNIVSSRLPQNKPHYVYVLAYPESMSGKVFYVGKGIRDRIDVHEREAHKGKKSPKCSIIRKIWRHDEKVAKKILAYFATHEEACMYEIALIFFMDELTNLTHGGDGSLGITHSEEARRKMSKSHKGRLGRPHSEEARQRLSESHKGKHPSEETRAKMREAQKGRVPPSAKGRIVSEETRQKQRESHKGQKHSEETRRKMCEAQKLRRDVERKVHDKPA